MLKKGGKKRGVVNATSALMVIIVARYRVCLYGRGLWLDDVIRKMERTFCLKKERKKRGVVNATSALMVIIVALTSSTSSSSSVNTQGSY